MLLFILFTSCTVYREFPIEIYKPGEIAIPPNVENIALVYRNFKYDKDTMQHFYLDDFSLRKAKKDPDNLDSLLVNYCFDEFASNIKSNTAIQNINVIPNIFKKHSGSKMPKLSSSLIDQISSSTKSDLIISLETFTYFFSEYSSNTEIPKSKEVVTGNVWAVYDPFTSKLISRETMLDTVFWNAYDDNGNYQRNVKLPPRLTALKIASQLAGENYSKKYFASWTKVQRMYSIPPVSDFKVAESMIQEGKWDEAISLWEKYISKKQGTTSIHALYNTALAYEMKDDIDYAKKLLDEAEILAKKYKSKDEIEMVELYQKVLTNRKLEIQGLE